MSKQETGHTHHQPSLWQRAVRPSQEWEDKDELLDVLYWLRQVASVLLGIMWGSLQMTGFVAMTLYIIASSAVILVYTSFYQKVDAEELGGLWEVMKEGFISAYALFLINWIIFYTAATVG